jgi:hypothetical protein
MDIDGVEYALTVGTNGTHSRASMQLTGQTLGDHVVELVSPAGCFDPVTVTCATGLAGVNEEWDRISDLLGDDEVWGERIDDNPSRDEVPVTRMLFDNYPNPFNPSTTIRYALPEKAHVKLEVFNMLGQSVAVLVDGEQPAGYHSAILDGSWLASGVYVYRLRSNEFVQTKRLLLLR